MEINKAIEEAKKQISQAVYLCESCPRVYQTGLMTVYERKSEMLHLLVSEIERSHSEIDRLKQKQIPKKPIDTEKAWLCPGCKSHIHHEQLLMHCRQCGQLITWEG